MAIAIPTITLDVIPLFPALVYNGLGISIEQDGGNYTISWDVSEITLNNTIVDDQISSTSFVVYNSLDGSYQRLPLQAVFDNVSLNTVIMTDSGNITVDTTTRLLIIKKTVAGPTNVNLPLAAAKIGNIKIVDWNGVAGANNITVIPSGTEKIQGLNTWQIAGDYASLVFDPVADLGYAV